MWSNLKNSISLFLRNKQDKVPILDKFSDRFVNPGISLTLAITVEAIIFEIWL